MEPNPPRRSNLNLAQLAAIGLVAGVLFHACVIYTVLGSGEDDSPGKQAPPVATAAVDSLATPTVAPLPDRTSCTEIRANPTYRSENERQYFLKNCVTGFELVKPTTPPL